MDSADHCRANLAECRGLLPSAQNDAEATVLKTLVRSWKMIANQLDRYAELMDARGRSEVSPNQQALPGRPRSCARAPSATSIRSF
jgi:hypothetical protein